MVGEDSGQNAATVTYAKQYENGNGYSSPVSVVADPHFMKVSGAVNHGGTTISLPFMMVFDADMTIKYVGNDINQIVQLIANATGVPYGGGSDPSGTCEGACNGNGSTGCYCDNQCHTYGDCCSDVCEVCGYCN